VIGAVVVKEIRGVGQIDRENFLIKQEKSMNQKKSLDQTVALE